MKRPGRPAVLAARAAALAAVLASAWVPLQAAPRAAPAAAGVPGVSSVPGDLDALLTWSDQWMDRGYERPALAHAEIRRLIAAPRPAAIEAAAWWRTLWLTQGLVAARNGELGLGQQAVERLLAQPDDPLSQVGAEAVQAALAEHHHTAQELAYAQAAAQRFDALCDVAAPPAGCDARLGWRLHHRVGLRLWVSLDKPRQALAAGQRALALAQRARDTDKQVQERGALALYLTALHEPAAAAEQMRALQPLAAGEHGTRVALMALMAQGAYRRHAQTSALASDTLWADAAQLALRLDMPRSATFALLYQADERMQHQRWRLALRAIHEAFVQMKGFDDPRLARNALHNRGIARLHIGERQAGEADVEQALSELIAAGYWREARRHLREYADALAALGEPEAALATARREGALNAQVDALTRQQALGVVRSRFETQRARQAVDELARERALEDARARNRHLQQGLWAALAALAGLALLGAALALRRLQSAAVRLARSEAQLLAQSERDALTGLANRRHLERRLGQPGAAFEGALLLVDADHFKAINDAHGHAGGDRALKAVAARMLAAVREDDVVGRWGGEEFVVFAPGASAEATGALAQRLSAAVAAQPVDLGGGVMRTVRVSVGWASFPLPGQTAPLPWPAALRLVDLALYAAKAGGRGRCVGVVAAQVSVPGDVAALEADWAAAVADGRVQLATSVGAPKQST